MLDALAQIVLTGIVVVFIFAGIGYYARQKGFRS